MDFLTLAKQRYSVRKFTDQTVEKEKIEKILEAGRLAPTAVNNQPQRILVLNEEAELAKLKECTKFHFDSKLVFIICYDKEKSWKRKQDGKDGGTIDASIVATHMMLEVQDLGLGATWVGSFSPEEVRKQYQIPENYEIVCLLVCGYPAEKPNPRHDERLPIEETVSFHKFN